jgi:hypothetical protein
MKLKTNTAPPLTANRLLYAVLHSLLIVLIVIIGTIKRKGLKRKERFGLPIIALNAVVNQRVGFPSIAYNVWCFAKAGLRRTNVELTTKDN